MKALTVGGSNSITISWLAGDGATLIGVPVHPDLISNAEPEIDMFDISRLPKPLFVSVIVLLDFPTPLKALQKLTVGGLPVAFVLKLRSLPSPDKLILNGDTSLFAL